MTKIEIKPKYCRECHYFKSKVTKSEFGHNVTKGLGKCSLEDFYTYADTSCEYFKIKKNEIK